MAKLAKLQISCRNTECDKGLHCYRQTKTEAVRAVHRLRGGKAGGVSAESRANSSRSKSQVPNSEGEAKLEVGPIRYCKECGVELVDWNRVHRRNLRDIEHTFDALRTEWIRHHFWHRDIDKLAVEYAFKKGRRKLRKSLESRLRSSIGRPAVPIWDGRQTPFGQEPLGRNILFFAQHATATCCRECVEGWHDIPRDRALEESEISYLTGLAMRYIVDRLPQLPEHGGTAPQEGSPSKSLKMSKPPRASSR